MLKGMKITENRANIILFSVANRQFLSQFFLTLSVFVIQMGGIVWKVASKICTTEIYKALNHYQAQFHSKLLVYFPKHLRVTLFEW